MESSAPRKNPLTRDVRIVLSVGLAVAVLVALAGVGGPGWLAPSTAFLALTVGLAALAATVWFLAMEVRSLRAVLDTYPYPGEAQAGGPTGNADGTAGTPEGRPDAGAPEGAVRAFTPRGGTWENTHVLLLEGIGERTAGRLHALGVTTVGDLVRADGDRLARELGIEADQVRRWQAMGSLTQVHGVGPQYAEVLVDAGVRGVRELARADPVELLGRIRERAKGRRTRLQGNDVGAGTVRRWVEAAEATDGTMPEHPGPREAFGRI